VPVLRASGGRARLRATCLFDTESKRSLVLLLPVVPSRPRHGAVGVVALCFT
jgi:hypothetical protein